MPKSIFEPAPPPAGDAAPAPLVKRLMWFAAIAACSGAAVAGVAYMLRGLLFIG